MSQCKYDFYPGAFKLIGGIYRFSHYGTGIPDRNGTEIFEGDIVALHLPIYNDKDYIEKRDVRWMPEDARFGWPESGLTFCKSNSKCMEIIGSWL